MKLIQIVHINKYRNSKPIKCVSHTKTNILLLFIEVRKNTVVCITRHTYIHTNSEWAKWSDVVSEMVEKLFIIGP
jgi:hypothetical protein